MKKEAASGINTFHKHDQMLESYKDYTKEDSTYILFQKPGFKNRGKKMILMILLSENFHTYFESKAVFGRMVAGKPPRFI